VQSIVAAVRLEEVQSVIEVGPFAFEATRALSVVGIAVCAWVVSRLFQRSLERVAARGSEANASAYYAVGRIGHYLIVAFGVLIALQVAGLDLSSLAVGAGALGLGVGLGLQQAVNNFVSGLILLFERSVKVGDFVELTNGLQGTVRSINVRSTVLTTNDNLDVVVPNSIFTNSVMTNWTMTDVSRRIHVPFGVAYGSDKELVTRAALEAAARVPAEVTDTERRPPQVWLVGFADSSLNFELVVWVGRALGSRPGNTRARYLWELETSLRAHGIEIPFPQRDLHLRSGFTPLDGERAAAARPAASGATTPRVATLKAD